VRCISDGREYSAGDIAISGRSIRSLSAQGCVSLGVGRKFQTASVFDALTVADCLHIARSFRNPPSLWRSRAHLELPAPALRIAELTGLLSRLHVLAAHLPHGMKQALELSMVLALEPSILLLDEPTAGLTKTERAAVGSLLGLLAKEHQISVLLIEHDLDFVRTVCNRLVVLHIGEILIDGMVSDVVESEVVRSVYLGEAMIRP
jgi:branched-chain amino acid transport system permease protein